MRLLGSCHAFATPKVSDTGADSLQWCWLVFEMLLPACAALVQEVGRLEQGVSLSDNGGDWETLLWLGHHGRS